MRLPYFGTRRTETPPPRRCTDNPCPDNLCPDNRRRKRPARVAMSLLAAGALLFGGDLPAVLAQAPSDEATLAAAQAAPQIEGPASPFSLMRGGTARPTTPTAAAPGTLPQQVFDRFIVTYTQEAKQRKMLRDGDWDAVRGIVDDIMDTVDVVSEAMNVDTKFLHNTSTDDAVIQTSKTLNKNEAQEFMAKVASDPDVASVEPDYINYPAAEGDITFQYNDPQYSKQWNLTNPTTGVQNTGNARLRRGANVKVAVLDTGYVAHPDLVTGMANGYDFISDPLSARDGDGRDPDPKDEGDYAPYNLCKDQANARTSTWHGTSVAGVIGARGNNRMGIVGTADLARVQPVRVLGRCGGRTSDIADAIIWAAGGHVDGVPDNTYPSKIINMSLGTVSTCPAAYQRAIDIARSKGAIVVAAAGNGNTDASKYAPANCMGVITVGATTKAGTRASFSNYGTRVNISAPGEDILTLSMNSLDRPDNTKFSYDYESGTSMAAPHVSALLAQQLVNGTTMTTEQVYQAFTLMRTNRINCDKVFCSRGIINSFYLAKKTGNLDANGKLAFQSPPRKVIAKGLSAGASKEKIADGAGEAAEATAASSAQATGTNEENLAGYDQIPDDRIPGTPAMEIPEDTQVYDLNGDAEPITQDEPLVTNPAQKPREAEEQR
ncbi:S8 family peptidase [uncultured Rothia sp.]|uniref:S8 family peptidase n=1 Tax=uncultured Rothia sp. TaxID=316088 RepID=UPI0028DCB897|nr:S8 family peptidase [uncultured Rothia sp.]